MTNERVNNFKGLISSPLMNCDHVYRYSGTKMVENESLATHIYETQMLGYMIIYHLINECHEDINSSIYLEKALHHDLEESVTGDVARPLKYHNKDVRYELQNIAVEIAYDLYMKYFNADYFHLWSEAKEGKEGYILKVVDMLTVVNKAIKEVSFLNNMYFLRVCHEVTHYLKEIYSHIEESPLEQEASRDYILSLLKEAEATLNQILEEHKGLLSRYDIVNNSMIAREENHV